MSNKILKLLVFLCIFVFASCSRKSEIVYIPAKDAIPKLQKPKIFTIDGLNTHPTDQGYLVVDLQSGFSNRMRTISAAYSAALYTNRKLVIIWNKSYDCIGTFHDFFSNAISEIKEEDFGFEPDFILEHHFQHNNIERIFAGQSSYLNLENLNSSKAPILYLFTPWSFKLKHNPFSKLIEDSSYMLRFLHPVPEIAERVSAYIEANQLNSKKVIGIHHRTFGANTGDDHLPLGSSPIDAHFPYIDAELQNSPDSVFILATDSEESREILNKRYNTSGRQIIYTYPLIKITRSTITGQRDAIIEWYLLANTHYIIGTNQSSFSDVPALLTKEKRKIPVGPPVWDFSDSICFNHSGNPVYCGTNFDLANFDVFGWKTRAWEPSKINTYVPKIKYFKKEDFRGLDEIPFDPTIEDFGDSYLVAFRYETHKHLEERESFIALSVLDKKTFSIKPLGENLDQDYIKLDLTIDSKVSKLSKSSKVKYQLEDPRLFKMNGKYYLLFTETSGNLWNDRPRDMFISEILFSNNSFKASRPVRLSFPFGEKQRSVWGNSKDWEMRDWAPLVYENELYMIYSLDQFVILKCDPLRGSCQFKQTSLVDKKWYLNFGKPSPGSQAILVQNQFYEFFFSTAHFAIDEQKIRKSYFLFGAYTFENNPSFQIKDITSGPIFHDDFIDNGGGRTVVHGAVYNENLDEFILSFGRHNLGMGFAFISKDNLDRDMVPMPDPSNTHP